MASPGLAGALGAFSQEAWARNAAAYETIRSMPFNAELAAGTLPQDRFREVAREAHPAGPDDEHAFRFVMLERAGLRDRHD